MEWWWWIDDDDDDDNWWTWWIADDELLLRIVDRREALTLISSRDNYQSFSPSQTSDTLRAGFELPQNQFRLYWRKLCNSNSYCITCEKDVNSLQITCLNLPWRFRYMDILPKQHWLVPRTDSKYGKKHIKSEHVL